MAQVLSLGMLCVIGAFAMGIESAGEGGVHPFAKSEAALQGIVTGAEPVPGDVNGNSAIDAEDANLLFQAEHGRITLSAEQIGRGDINGNGRIDEEDLGFVLQRLSNK